ncbi:hypothetical protein N8198_03190 [Gammaproteobacteria bacterium]|nr:hypothetical protein [Gammaproteobacteria bacterium]
MNPHGSPLRLLAKTYANELITREQYVEIRAHLLKRLASNGTITAIDLKNFTTLTQGPEPEPQARRYTTSDWLIIGLGLIASAVLAFVLYG